MTYIEDDRDGEKDGVICTYKREVEEAKLEPR